MTKKLEQFSNSIYKESYRLSIVLLGLIILTSIFVSIILLNNISREMDKIYIQQAEKIDREITEKVENISNFLKYLGSNIAANCDKENIDNISDYLSANIPLKFFNKELTIVTLFDWISPDKEYVANSLYGRLPKKINLSHRSYLSKTSILPWKLFFAEPTIGLHSAENVIPIGMGVIDENSNFFGTIASGINIKKLGKLIDRELVSDGLSFIITDLNFKPVISSKNYQKLNLKKINMNIFLKKMNSEISISTNSFGFFSEQLYLGNNLKFMYYKKLSNYPYYLILGEDVIISRQNLNSVLTPYLVVISFINSELPFGQSMLKSISLALPKPKCIVLSTDD